MPVLLNTETGLAENTVSPQESLAQGTHEVPMVAPDGTIGSVPFEQAQEALRSGYTQPSQTQLGELLREAKYSTTPEQIKAGLHGVAKGVLPFGGGTALETALGVKPEDIRGREEFNPGTVMAGELAGLTGSAFIPGGQAKVLGSIGNAAARALPAMSGLAGKVAPHVLKQAAEMAVFQGGDEISKLIQEDPKQSLETAVTNIGFASLLGAGTGGAIGVANPLWEATVGKKLTPFLDDFKGRLNKHLTNPNPIEAMSEELGTHYKAIKDMADDVYGPSGLKSQDIAKALPEMSPRMSEQVSGIASRLQAQVDSMTKDAYSYPPRLTSKLTADLNNFTNRVTKEGATSHELFAATQDLKTTLQGYSKFDKFVKPVDEAYDFVRTSKELARGLRESLEDEAVWGKAATRQKAINEAFVSFKPALEDFEKKFTTELAGERIIDPGKIATFSNQLGKPNAEIKKDMLGNFLSASEKYRGVVNDTHLNLGLSPLEPIGSLSNANAALKDITSGEKFADFLVKRGMAQLGGDSLGVAIGSAVGHSMGSGTIGALLGQQALGPFFKSVLPAIIRPILEGKSNAAGFKGAVEYGVNVVKGSQIADKAVKSLFKAGEDVLPTSLIPTEKQQQKIDKFLRSAQATPEVLLASSRSFGHYLPQHNEAAGETVSRVAQLVNASRPNEDAPGILDAPRQPSQVEKSAYTRKLSIIEQPLVILNDIKQATITPQDVAFMKAAYPSLYTSLSQKMVNEVIEQKNAGTPIPYKLRLGLSAFLGMPLDASISPASIVANGLNSKIAPLAQQSPQGQSRGSKQAFKELPGTYATDSQSRERDKGVKT